MRHKNGGSEEEERTRHYGRIQSPFLYLIQFDIFCMGSRDDNGFRNFVGVVRYRTSLGQGL
jgi:hypothetical protein